MNPDFTCSPQPPDLLGQFSGARCLVTGGLGFIGSHLARALVAAQADVIVVDAKLEGMGANGFNIADIDGKIALHTRRLSDPAVTDLLENSTYIFNLAGSISHIDSMNRPLDDLAFNYTDQLAFLAAIQKSCPQATVVYTGTRQIYGVPVHLPIREDHIVQPVDFNGVHKHAAEWAHILHHRIHGLNTVSLRLTNTYGPGQLMGHNRQGFLPWFVRLAVSGQCLELFGDGQQTRDLNHVDDVVTALLLAASRPEARGKIYNLGHTQSLTLEAIADTLVKLCPAATIKKIPFPEEKKKIDLGSTRCDFTKIKTDLSWEPRILVEEGVTHMVAFAKKYRKHYWT